VEGCANGCLYVNSAKWAELPKSYQQMVTTVAEDVAGDLIAKYDSRNPPSIKRRLAPVHSCVRSRSIFWMPATRPSQELFTEVSAKNAVFKKLYDSTTAFRNDQYAWHQICETTYDAYMIRQRRRI
jgi:TRAP-type mannitol/chloroaromatic compound transport system substrate-binding protein